MYLGRPHTNRCKPKCRGVVAVWLLQACPTEQFDRGVVRRASPPEAGINREYMCTTLGEGRGIGRPKVT